MRAPLSRTPICLDTLCCRLDNGNISLGETGTTIPWKTGSQQCLWPGTSQPCMGSLQALGWRSCLGYSSFCLSLGACDMSTAQSCICSVMLEQERRVHHLYYLYRDTIRFLAVEEEKRKKKLIPSILFPIELNRFLIESLFLWVIDLTVRAN